MEHASPDPMDERPPGEAAFTAVRPVTTRRRRGPIAVAIVAIAFLAGTVLIKGIDPGPGLPVPTAPPRAAVHVASFGPTASPTASPTQDPPSRDPTVTPHPAVVSVPAQAGTVQLVPPDPTTARLTITLPAGWRKSSPGLYLKPDRSGPVGLSIGTYSIEHVNTFPCRWASGSYTDTAFPRTAEGQALALSAFWGQDPNLTPFFSNSGIAPIATKPRQTAIEETPAWALQILIPSTLDLRTCDGDQLVLWQSADGTVRSGFGPGEIDQLWVLDLDGEPVVIDAARPSLATASQQAELQAVINSIAIRP